jgi:hypothetical protein
MQWGDILIGAALLLFGRRLFWLFVGGVGFIVGFNFASQALQGRPDWVILLVAAGVGVLAAIASIFLERVVVAIAGFFAGAYCLSAAAAGYLHDSQPAVSWIAFAVGGIIGAVLTAMLLDPALIILSSLAGATAISQNVPLNSSGRGFLFIVLLVVGVIVHAAHYSRSRIKKPPPPPQPAS